MTPFARRMIRIVVFVAVVATAAFALQVVKWDNRGYPDNQTMMLVALAILGPASGAVFLNYFVFQRKYKAVV